MVPRPETEVLAGWALELLPPPPARPVGIDLGTGSGCIACALAAERPDLSLVAVDVCPEAAALARANVAALGLGARVSVEVSDLFAARPEGRADLIVSNPPYLPTGIIDTLAPEVSRHDPRLALDGGADGLRLIRRIVREAPRRLAAGGALVLETAGGDQVRRVAQLLRRQGFVDVRTRADLAGVERFVAGRWPA
jgi:release factor glutamine methyltransferase